MIGTYASAIAICVAAILLGRGICLLCGHHGSNWLAPPVGFAALMFVCEVAISLPGRGWTAVVAVVVLCAGSVWVGLRRRAAWPSAVDGLTVAIVVLGITTVPFLANARVGVLGISVLNDTHWHLFLAQGLLQPSIRHLDTYGGGYPLGPHAVAATFAWGLASSVDKTLTGVLIATPVLTGLAALGALGDLSRSRRWLVAILSAIPYMAAAWYVQSAFKEPIMSLLMLGLVLAVQAGRRQRFARPLVVVIPIAVLLAGVIYDYSYPGLVWPAAILVCWLALELVLGGGWRRLPAIARDLRASLPAFGVGALVLVALAAPDVHRMYTFWHLNGGSAIGTTRGVTTSALANLTGPLNTLEGFNIWLWGDVRFVSSHPVRMGALAGFAAIVFVFALVRALERRDFAWVGAMFGFALVYAYAKYAQSPYVAAKALAVPAPLLVLGSGGALMRECNWARWRSFATLAVAGAAVMFFVFAFQSDFLVLRDAQVGPDNHVRELRSLRPLVHGRPTLVLFYDDYFKWELLGVPVSSPLFPSPTPVRVQPAKPWTYRQPLDFNSVDAAMLNRFDYVITTRTNAQSQPPPNFHLIGASKSYEVWKREGPTRPFQVLPESGQPGAILDCRKPADRRISHKRGVAAVRPAPVQFPVPVLVVGNSARLVLHLAAGEWELSLPFVSPQSVTVTGAGLDVRLPPNLDRPGPIWSLGRVHSAGAPITLTVRVADPAVISSADPVSQYFAPQSLIATRVGADRMVPLRAACGRYVDWYQLT